MDSLLAGYGSDSDDGSVFSSTSYLSRQSQKRKIDEESSSGGRIDSDDVHSKIANRTSHEETVFEIYRLPPPKKDSIGLWKVDFLSRWIARKCFEKKNKGGNSYNFDTSSINAYDKKFDIAATIGKRKSFNNPMALRFTFLDFDIDDPLGSNINSL